MSVGVLVGLRCHPERAPEECLMKGLFTAEQGVLKELAVDGEAARA